MSLIHNALIEKKKREEFRESNAKFIGNVANLLEMYTYELIGYFGKEFVSFNKNIVEIEISRWMCEFYLRLKLINGKHQFIFSTNADLSGVTKKELEIVHPEMSDEELKIKIESSLKYLLSRTI